jgi:hypothetical protein
MFLHSVENQDDTRKCDVEGTLATIIQNVEREYSNKEINGYISSIFIFLVAINNETIHLANSYS